MNNTTPTNYEIYKKLLQIRVRDTKAELDEAERVYKAKRAAHEAAKGEEKAFEEGQDELMSQCK